ncbi:MAG: hypothetical protein RIQ60_2596 [Pseudomonadota bacterium]|jgi:hypothetical protein
MCAALVCTTGMTWAQAAAPAAAASSPSSPAKKALVKRVLQLQQPGIEAIARGLVEQPAFGIQQQVSRSLQSVPEDKREAVGKAAFAEVRKFVEDVSPILKKKAVELAPTTLGPLLEERFSEDELKQLANWLDSSVSKKYQELGGEMQRAITETLVRDSRSVVEPKLRALEDSLMKRLGVSDKPAAGARAPTPTPSK